jgi:hypothetical protein
MALSAHRKQILTEALQLNAMTTTDKIQALVKSFTALGMNSSPIPTIALSLGDLLRHLMGATVVRPQV